jgi:hypothetical protein
MLEVVVFVGVAPSRGQGERAPAPLDVAGQFSFLAPRQAERAIRGCSDHRLPVAHGAAGLAAGRADDKLASARWRTVERR